MTEAHAIGDRLVLGAGDLRLELAPGLGGSIAAFGVERAQGYTPIFRRSPEGLYGPLEAGCFPLVPYSNRVRDGRFVFDGREVRIGDRAGKPHALHGDAWVHPWQVVDEGEFSAEMLYVHQPADWPWAYEARQRFDLDAEGFTVRLACTNLDETPMPCGLGIHPYFPCSATTVLDAQVDWVWTIDDEVLPVERVPATGRYALGRRRICGQDLDNGYEGWAGEAEILWPESGFGLTFTCPDATRFQVYSPREGGVFVAEPVTNANAALNRPQSEWPSAGLAILHPGEEASMVARFTVAELV
jgi:aldose 1-epimerase